MTQEEEVKRRVIKLHLLKIHPDAPAAIMSFFTQLFLNMFHMFSHTDLTIVNSKACYLFGSGDFLSWSCVDTYPERGRQIFLTAYLSVKTAGV